MTTIGSALGSARMIAYACSLHASTDFREKLYKVVQNALKLPAISNGHPHALKTAATISQSRGIFKLLKWVNNVESYRKAADEYDPLLRRLKKAEAWLNTIVSVMQDAISLDKLSSRKLLSPRFAWWMNFLDLLLTLLLAGLAAHALSLLHTAAGDLSPKARRQALLLRLELGVRLADALALLSDTSVLPGSRRQLWPAPSPMGAVLASALSATCATTAVGVKKWAALPAPQPAALPEGKGREKPGAAERGQRGRRAGGKVDLSEPGRQTCEAKMQ